jgi:hypothetical protein
MAQQSSWLNRLEPFNLTTLTMPQVDIKTPFLEASNHVCKITDQLFLDGLQMFPSNTLRLVDRPGALVTSFSVGVLLLFITWKV